MTKRNRNLYTQTRFLTVLKSDNFEELIANFTNRIVTYYHYLVGRFHHFWFKHPNISCFNLNFTPILIHEISSLNFFSVWRRTSYKRAPVLPLFPSLNYVKFLKKLISLKPWFI